MGLNNTGTGEVVSKKTSGNSAVAAALMNNLQDKNKNTPGYILQTYGYTVEGYKRLLKLFADRLHSEDKGLRDLMFSPEKFMGMTSEKALGMFMESGLEYKALKNLDTFSHVSLDAFFNIITTKGEIHCVDSSLEKVLQVFPEFDLAAFLQKLLMRYQKKGENQNLYHFNVFKYIPAIDKATAQKIIAMDSYHSTAPLLEHGLDKIQGMSHQEIVDELKKISSTFFICHHMWDFRGVDHQELLEYLFEKGYAYAFYRLPDDENKDGRNDRIFAALGEKKLDYTMLAKKALKGGLAHIMCNRRTYLGDRMKYLRELSSEIAQALIEAGYQDAVAENVDRFIGLTEKDLYALSKQYRTYAMTVISNGKLDRFSGVDRPAFLSYLIGKEGSEDGSIFSWSRILSRLDLFPGIDHEDVAFKLTQLGYGGQVSTHLYQFHLDHDNSKALVALIQAGFPKAVQAYIDTPKEERTKDHWRFLVDFGRLTNNIMY